MIKAHLSHDSGKCKAVKILCKVNHRKWILRIMAENAFNWKYEMHLKSVVCCSHRLHVLANILTNFSIEANSVDPDQTAPTGAV